MRTRCSLEDGEDLGVLFSDFNEIRGKEFESGIDERRGMAEDDAKLSVGPLLLGSEGRQRRLWEKTDGDDIRRRRQSPK